MLSKNLIKEIQALHLRKQRDLRKSFIAEGVKTVMEIVAERAEIIRQVFGTTEFLKKNASELSKNKIQTTEISEDELKKISLQNTPNQVLALCNYFETPQPVAEQPVFALYLDDIRDPGNLGTIIRLCDWFGFKTLYCSSSSCEFYNPKVIQSTMGAFLRVNVVYTGIEKLSAQFENIYGAVLSAENIYSEQLQEGLLIIGNEANGISEETMKFVTKGLTIPAGGNGGAESLNAAMAASIMTSEFYRQLFNASR